MDEGDVADDEEGLAAPLEDADAAAFEDDARRPVEVFVGADAPPAPVPVPVGLAVAASFAADLNKLTTA